MSRVARVPEVRTHLIELFRAIIAAERASGHRRRGSRHHDRRGARCPRADPAHRLTRRCECRGARPSSIGSSAEAVGEQLRERDAADSKVVDFMNAADGVTTVDSTELDFDQTVDAVIAVIGSVQAVTG